ncbi:RNA polymerase, sigma-24 subunit, ECF subfamily [Pedosphaera parvula Ellin514]|uniref:RNA polymerase, sigma-24 subunit, ECF subfamily n=2 Tax=Pedosphaera TaxID=1032526 RepID=B9XBI4_PEDPL|nr:RNA polymerase, sigma-24 subunit, ECF subfamily [Pedosphaera parvula Ellin514]
MDEMYDQSDAQLLRLYAEHDNEAAFREIVVRHTGLVYGSALRQVASPDLAQDVAQSVFTDLARKAKSMTRTLDEHASLLGWLYRSTRFAALTQLRNDHRRQAREKQVMEHFDTASETVPDWGRVRPALDEAMSELSEEAREALLLRYFKNSDFRTIGQCFKISDDTAQKRVSRALERLRQHLTNRGVTTTAVALSTTLSTNAATVAPAGLSATLSSAALAATFSGTATTIAMTTLQKSLITAAIVAAIGTSLYEARHASNSEIQVQALKQQQRLAFNQIEDLRKERDAALGGIAALKEEKLQWHRENADLPRLRGEVTRMRRDLKELAESNTAGNDPFVQRALKWKANEARLRQLFDDRPNQRIPEMELLSEDAWLDLARDEDLESESGIRKTLSEVRRYARNIFVNDLSDALEKYAEQNNGSLPTDILQLKTYFKKPVDDALLQPYKLLQTGKVSDMKGQWAITDTVVDAEYDTPWGIGPGSFGPMRGSSEAVATLSSKLNSAIKEFSDANNGKTPGELEQLIPYVKTAAQSNALEQLSRMNVRLGQK